MHSDFETANAMMTSPGHPMPVDFDLARFSTAAGEEKPKTTTLQSTDAVFGTRAAMSPERAIGRALDARSDVLWCGSLLFDLAERTPGVRKLHPRRWT